jgi:hypothetical protein
VANLHHYAKKGEQFMSITIFWLAPFLSYGRALIIITIEAVAIYISLKPSWKKTLLSVIAMNCLSAFFCLLITRIIDPDLFNILVSSYSSPQLTNRIASSLAFWMILGKLNPVLTLFSLLFAFIFNTALGYVVLSLLFKAESKSKIFRTSCIANIASFAFLFWATPRM